MAAVPHSGVVVPDWSGEPWWANRSTSIETVQLEAGISTPGTAVLQVLGKAAEKQLLKSAAKSAEKKLVDYAAKNTINRSAKFASEREARALARTKLGRDPVEFDAGKLRSQNGRWQYRAKAQDLQGHGPGDGPHIHLERLNPSTGEVLENWHFRW